MLAVVQIPLGGPDQTAGDPSALGPRGSPTSPPTLSGRVRSGACPCSGIWHGPTDFVCDPTRPDQRTKSAHVETERTSLRPDKIRGLVGDPSGPLVLSGRVRSGPCSGIQKRHDQTQPATKSGRARLVEFGHIDSGRAAFTDHICRRRAQSRGRTGTSDVVTPSSSVAGLDTTCRRSCKQPFHHDPIDSTLQSRRHCVGSRSRI